MPDSNPNANAILVGRQPVLNERRAVFGYELFLQSKAEDDQGFQSHSDLVLEVLATLFDPTILANGRCVFIKLSTASILDGSYKALPPQISIVEINIAGVHWNNDLIDASRALRESGYRLCLTGNLSELQVLSELKGCFDFIKIDLSANVVAADCEKHLPQWRQLGTQIIASGIDLPDQFDQAKQAGFDLFEGYFFFKPQILEHREIPVAQMNQLKLLQALGQPELDVPELEKIIRTDPMLSVGLLRLINSAAFGISKSIESIQRALLLLGPNKVRRWATSLVTKQLAGDKPSEILSTCLTRAVFCEKIGPLALLTNRQLDLFMMGIISGLPPMMDVPLCQLLDELSVGKDIREGLNGGKSPMGCVFAIALAHESGDFTAMSKVANAQGLDIGLLARNFYDVTREVQDILNVPTAAAAA